MGFKLSVAVITYNEENNLGRCLDSVFDLADEIVVVDSGSEDQTRAIANSFNAKVLERAFDGHIQQKNFALQQCQNDMVLSLDADEALSNKLKGSIREIKNQGKSGIYEMSRLTNYRGHWIRHCGWYPDRKVRLFDRKLASWGGENPHDRIIPGEGQEISRLKGDILHYSYPDLASHLKQIEFFTGIMAKGLVEKGKKPSMIKELFAPAFKFFQSYFLQLGFLDGYAGFQVCRISAFATYMKYARVREYYQKPTS